MSFGKKEILRFIGPIAALAIGGSLIVRKSVSIRGYHTEGAIVALGGVIFCLAGFWDLFRAIQKRKKEPIQPLETTHGK